MTQVSSICHVLQPLPIGNGYDYSVPSGMVASVGAFVEVPFGKTFAIGVIWGTGTTETAQVPLNKLKPLGEVLNVPSLPQVTRSFIDWMANYTLAPRGALLKMVMGAKWRVPSAKDTADFPLPNPDQIKVDLTEAQVTASDQLKQAIRDEKFSVTLLDGVTGSGKTEVYAEALAQCFKNGHQALVLLPEIAMTAALIDRLTARFGVQPVLWHSEMTDKQRRINWHAIADGRARFVLGARSALMLPYPDLGLIVVDEEHEAAYKQEEGVIYHGRDMAVVRGNIGKIPVVLASATPSLETFHNVQKGKYGHVVLPQRFGAARMPKINLIDLRREKLSAQNFITEPLIQALQETVANKQQAMLFLNRRGYAPLTLCRACGHRVQCPRCSCWLIAHKKTGRLHCHHCDYSIPAPVACPKCGAEGRMAACGPGIERIQEEMAERLPTIRTAIMASDTLSGPKAAADLVKQMDDQTIDVLIGTQIMAKGYHFPRLTLVGVIDADLGLGGGDPRIVERTFQLLQQVSGRSGRAEDPGRVYLQTVAPEHPVMQAMIKGDRDAFMQTEMTERKAYHLPPFARLAALTVTGAQLPQVVDAARAIAAAAPQNAGIELMGPAPAPFAFLRGKHRYRLLVRGDTQIRLSSLLQKWLATVSLPRNLRLTVDIDPYNFM